MSLGPTLLRFIQELRLEAGHAHPSLYKKGYLAACEDIQEELEDLMWDRGEDVEDEADG